MEKVWILLSAAVLILGFQNCSNSANFAATGELIAKAESDDTSDDTVIDVSQPVSDNDDASNDDDVTAPPATPPVVVAPPTMPPSNDDVMVPPTTPPVAVVPPTMPPSDDTMVPPTTPPVVVAPPADDDEQGALQFVCVLRSNGKSVKIALSNEGTLGGKKGTPSDVCMSENACLNILGKSFDVVSAEKRGFCPNKNPHVIAMTDMQIKAALARAALIKSLAP